MCRYTSAHRRQNGPPRDDLEPFARVPEIGVGDRGARILDGAHRQKSHAVRLDQLLKERVGQDGGPMPAALEGHPEGQYRMDVAGAPDGRQQELERAAALHRIDSGRRMTTRSTAWPPVVDVRLHSANAASRLEALLNAQILPVFSRFAPGDPGAAPGSATDAAKAGH